MKQYLKIDPWRLIEDEFHPEYNRISEATFSLGNGRFGQRGYLEEEYSGDSLIGNYIAGIYYPDKTKVGWWKNGYPEYFAKVLNAANWASVKVQVNQQIIDLHKCEILSFFRELDMKRGVLSRKCTLKLDDGSTLSIYSKRCISQTHKEIALLDYTIEFHDDMTDLQIESILDFDVKNEDANYDDVFWEPLFSHGDERIACLAAQTLKTGFTVRISSDNSLSSDGDNIPPRSIDVRDKAVIHNYSLDTVKAGQRFTLHKKVRIQSPLFYTQSELLSEELRMPRIVADATIPELMSAHADTWDKLWSKHDVQLDGDPELQQGIRFCIFQLLQTYNCEDGRLNIGPKGFTGEKYGGTTYWDTEAYCLPFYLHTKDQDKVKKLIFYRYRHLPHAIANAEKLGFKDGAALYPMVTMNGEECHNEWEITFEEIHRNSAIAYAIYNYIQYTDDKHYLSQGGLEVLIAISRFWSQRSHWSEDKNAYVILGVTGPNEYENNINNNWYTNRMAAWCLSYTSECIDYIKGADAESWNEISDKVNWTDAEQRKWKDVEMQMYYPVKEGTKIFLQQDGFLDKEIIPASSLPEDQIPLYQHQSWDRILRSCFIKQADVLQGLYMLHHEYDSETIRENYNFYEPLTVHESSLSPCIHSMLAARLGDLPQTLLHLRRSVRLDLDDYNNNTREGCHITSMAGAWIALIEGIAGYTLTDGRPSIAPHMPIIWRSLRFSLHHRGVNYQVELTTTDLHLSHDSASAQDVYLYGNLANIGEGATHSHPITSLS